MEKRLILIGAYGRTAKLEDWHAGKDFRIIDGPHCSIRDVDRMKADGYTHVVLYVYPDDVTLVPL